MYIGTCSLKWFEWKNISIPPKKYYKEKIEFIVAPRWLSCRVMRNERKSEDPGFTPQP
jgi:hypothetical protein